MCYSVDVIELRKEMAEKEINNISQLSEKSGIDRNTLSKVLNGKCRPSTTVMEKLAIALELESTKAGSIFFKPDLRNT